MAGMNDEKMRMMEDEMNRFEAEIALPVLPPPPPPPPPPPVTTAQAQRAVIGANTYNQVQRRLEEQQMVPAVPDYQNDPSLPFPSIIQPVAPYAAIPPPPPPPPLPPPPPPPPPPPTPILVPHQVHRGPPMRHPVMRPLSGPPIMPGPPPPAPTSFMPPTFMAVPGPPMMDTSMVAPVTAAMEPPIAPMQTPVPAIVSATPLIYSAKTPGEADDSSAAVPADGDSSTDDLSVQKRKKLKTDSTEVHMQQRAKEMSERVRASTIVTVGPAVPGQTAVDDTNTSSRKKEKKSKKHVRMAGGQVWEDSSLTDWEEDDFRIFCGDLGNDVTDEILTRAFSKYQSFLKAKVIRDKRSNKTKGFGFVSFKDPQDFIKAMKEMNGRYVGSRPIKLRKSTWRARNIETVRKKEREKAALIGLLTGR